MKPEPLEIEAQDRLATREEIRRAISFNSEDLLELCHRQGNFCQIDADFGGIVRYAAEELEFFSYLSEADDSVTN